MLINLQNFVQIQYSNSQLGIQRILNNAGITPQLGEALHPHLDTHTLQYRNTYQWRFMQSLNIPTVHKYGWANWDSNATRICDHSHFGKNNTCTIMHTLTSMTGTNQNQAACTVVLQYYAMLRDGNESLIYTIQHWEMCIFPAKRVWMGHPMIGNNN